MFCSFEQSFDNLTFENLLNSVVLIICAFFVVVLRRIRHFLNHDSVKKYRLREFEKPLNKLCDLPMIVAMCRAVTPWLVCASTSTAAPRTAQCFLKGNLFTNSGLWFFQIVRVFMVLIRMHDFFSRILWFFVVEFVIFSVVRENHEFGFWENF